MTFGERVRAEREERGLSREELAQMTGISASQLFKVEMGERGVSAQNLITLSKVYGVDPTWLATEEGQKYGTFLSPEEQQLIQLFRKTPPHLQRGLLNVIRDIVAALPM